MTPLRFVLASASPRRKALLDAAGFIFDIVESGVEEVRRDGEDPGGFALRMACEKALGVSMRDWSAIVLGADTVVVCGGQVLGKPAGPAEARSMLQVLSGVTHTVITAFALARGGAILGGKAVASRVTFRALAETEIDDYIAGGEPLDKAGAYAIQGVGEGFIERVDGPRDNVMGLPVSEVTAALARAGIEPRPGPAQ